tara:strand:+ start:258 stop:947 length:690 start_codon:yes stop_codon:yes gene_type:complete
MHEQEHQGHGFTDRLGTQLPIYATGIGGNLLNVLMQNRLSGYDESFTSELARNAKAQDPRLKINQYTSSGNPFEDMTEGNMNAYNPRENRASFARGGYGFAAHELGHAEQYRNPTYRKFKPVMMASRIATQVNPASLLAMLAPNEEVASTAANINLATSLPMIAEEIDASRRGARLIKNTKAFGKMSRASKLLALARPFAGLPSYIIMGLLPYLQVQASKKAGDYEGTY